MSDEQKLKILIIEDEDLVARMYLKSLEFSGFEANSKSNGQEGIEAAKSTRPDLILLDIMMPGIDGIEVLQKLKADPATKDIPVVMLTNLSGDNDEKFALEKGANAFWIKSSVKTNEIGDKIREVLNVHSNQQKNNN